MTDKVPQRSTGSNPDHYSDLARLVGSISQNQVQQRALIYEFARIKLRRELYRQFEAGDWAGIQQQMLGLEVAISQVEEEFSRLPPASEAPSLTVADEPSATSVALRPITQHEVVFGDATPPAFLLGSQSVSVNIFDQTARPPSRLWFGVQLAGAALIGLALFVAFAGRTALQTWGLMPPQVVAEKSDVGPSAGESAQKVVSPGFPVPNAYGIYALSNGKLSELDPLPIRVPDPRISISAQISTPSRAHLPDGKLQFVVFRRDLVVDAPDHVSLRVVAQLMRALSFDPSGKASTNPVENAWYVRSNAYQLRVAPVPGNTEMIEIRSSDPDFTLPAGRYALVLKNIGYDFTVDGGATDTAHCLERTDAVNTPIYSECRAPQRQ